MASKHTSSHRQLLIGARFSLSDEPAARVDEDDTTFTDALLDQFAAYYLLSVLAIRALEAARQSHAHESEKWTDSAS